MYYPCICLEKLRKATKNPHPGSVARFERVASETRSRRVKNLTILFLTPFVIAEFQLSYHKCFTLIKTYFKINTHTGDFIQMTPNFNETPSTVVILNFVPKDVSKHFNTEIKRALLNNKRSLTTQ
jgi:hypothetical protein